MNLVTVTLLFLFPFAYKATEARSFIVIWVAQKMRNRRQEQEARQLKAIKKQTDMETEMGVHAAATSAITPNPAVSAQM